MRISPALTAATAERALADVVVKPSAVTEAAANLKLTTHASDAFAVLKDPTPAFRHLADERVGAVIGDWKLFTPHFDGPPILGSFQQQRFQDKFAAMNPFDMARVGLALAGAQSEHEREYIMKAVAAGNSVDDVCWFANQIRGKSDAWMQKNLRLSGNGDGDPGLSQQWSTSCGPATAQVLRGEMDPVYSLRMHQDNVDPHAIDPQPGASFIQRILAQFGFPTGNVNEADEQRSILENGGGVAVERGESGGKGMNFAQAFNTMTQWTGVTYIDHGATTATTRSDALKKLDADLAQGIPGALRISDGPSNCNGHAVAVTGVIAGPPKEYVLHDPWDGKTVYVKASDLAAGNIIPSIAGWSKLTDVYSST
jgi:hypothetical protein